MNNQLTTAANIARWMHYGQKDTVTGAPYINHVKRVVDAVEGDDAKTVAWLHDVIEDSDMTAADLIEAGIDLDLVQAVVLLTRYNKETVSYANYIESIKYSENSLALVVKLADLRDHLRPNCPERLRPRYEKALQVLTS